MYISFFHWQKRENKNLDLQLFINNKQWANNNVILEFFRVTIHHSWKARRLYYDVKKEMENEQEIDWWHLYQDWFGNICTLSYLGAKVLPSFSV